MDVQAGANGTLEVCSSAPYKRFTGEPSANFDPLSWEVNDWKQYGQDKLRTKALPFLILLACVLLTLFLFLLWRFIKCICVVCCQQEGYMKVDKILKSRKFKRIKIAFVIFAVFGIGACIHGMISMESEVASGFWIKFNSVAVYVEELLDEVKVIDGSVRTFSSAITEFNDIVNNDVNITDLDIKISDLSNVLDNLPDADGLISALNVSDAALKTYNAAALQTLTELPGRQNSSLSALQFYLPGVLGAASLLSNLSESISNYTAALNDLPPANQPPATNDGAIQSLQANQSALIFNVWNTSLRDISGNMTNLQSLSRTNITSFLLGNATSLQNAQQNVVSIIPGLQSEMASFQDSLSAANGTLSAIEIRLTLINTTVVALPSEANEALSSLRIINDVVAIVYENYTVLTEFLDDIQLQIPQPSALNNFRSVISAMATILLSSPLAEDEASTLEELRESLNILANKSSALDEAIQAFIQGAPYSDLISIADETGVAALDVASNLTATQNNITSRVVSANVLDDQLAELTLESSSIQASLEDNAINTVNLSTYLTNVDFVKQNIDAIRNRRNEIIRDLNNAVNNVREIAEDIISIQADVDGASETVNGTIETLDKDVIVKMNNFKNDGKKLTDKAQSYLYLGVLLLYGCCILLLTMAAASLFLNCPCLFCLTLLFMNILAVLLLILPNILSVGLVVEREGCHHIERIILREVGDSKAASPLLRYYLYGEGCPENSTSCLPKLMRDADIFDLDNVLQPMDDLQDQLNNSTYFQAVGKMQTLITSVLTNIQVVEDALNNLFNVSLSYSSINKLYIGLKAYICCDIAKVAYKQLISSVVAGICIWICMIIGIVILHKYDKLPDRGCCYGCKRFRLQDYEHENQFIQSMPPPHEADVVIVANRRSEMGKKSTF